MKPDPMGGHQPGVVLFAIFVIGAVSMPLMLLPSDGAWPVYGLVGQMLLFLWALRAGRDASGWIPTSIDGLRLPMALVIAYTVYLGFKLLPLPPDALALFSGRTLEVYRQAADGLSAGAWLPLSLDVGAGVRELLRFVFYVSLLVLVMALAGTVRRMQTLALAMLAVTVLMAVLALVKYYLMDFGQVRAAGPFGNANLFAGFVAMGLAFAIGLYFASGRADDADARQSTGGALLSKAVAVAIILVLAAALFASGSRAGALALLVTFAICLPFYVFTGGSFRQRLSSFWVVGLLLLLSLIWFGSDAVLNRLESDNDLALRLSFWRASLQMLQDYPLFGTGGGIWQYVYQGYWDPAVVSYASPRHAHNDHLQLLAEQGVIGYLLLGAFLLACLWVLIKALVTATDERRRGLILGAMSAVIYMLLHAFVDNNFQITVTTAFMFLFLGIGLSAARESVRS